MKERNRIFRRKSGSFFFIRDHNSLPSVIVHRCICCSAKFLPSADHGATQRKACSADRAAGGFEHTLHARRIFRETLFPGYQKVSFRINQRLPGYNLYNSPLYVPRNLWFNGYIYRLFCRNRLEVVIYSRSADQAVC